MDNHVKNPTTFEEQIKKFKSRGLIIEDEEEALFILKKVQYYRLSAYALGNITEEQFVENFTFSKLFSLYEFDRKLRILCLSMIEYVEISLRTRISYILAHNYGPMGYLQATHFKKQEFHGEFLSDLNREIKRSREVFIKHHKENYSGQIPIWVVTEIMSFGTLSKLFANMKNTDSNELSKRFYGVPAIYFKSWLRALSQLRNICAHYGRLYNRLFTSKPKLEKSDSESGILPNQLFSHILLLKKLMHETDWKSKSIELEVLIEEYLEVIDLDKLGFPIDWKTYI